MNTLCILLFFNVPLSFFKAVQLGFVLIVIIIYTFYVTSFIYFKLFIQPS